MNDSVSIRRIDWSNGDDVSAYLAVLDSYARDPMGQGRGLAPDVLRRLPTDLAKHPSAKVLLAEHDGCVVGAATCFLGYSTFLARPLLNLHDIAVLPHKRGLGIGDHLLSGVEALARDLQCCRVSLEVRSDNPNAIRLYTQSGFIAGTCDRFMEKAL